MRYISSSIALCGVLLFGAQPALAQEDEIREISDAQYEMNNKAVEAVQNEEYAKAIKLYQASLALGEVNITYLNMARTYHRMGECGKAKRMYRKTRDVRYKVASPTPAEINEALNTYESQLYKDCKYGELTVICEPGKLDLFLNGNGPVSCPSSMDPLRLEEGEYKIRGELEGYEPNEIVVKVGRVDPTTVALTLAKAAVATNPDKPDTTPQIIIKNDDGSRERLEEINKRLEIEAREKAEKEERARKAEIARQRQLDEERVRNNALLARKVELERKNTRINRIGWITAGAIAAVGVGFDTCLGFGGVRGRFDDVPSNFDYCNRTFNGSYDNSDLIPLAFYGGALIPLIVSHVAQKTRRKNFELEYEIAPSNISDEQMR